METKVKDEMGKLKYVAKERGKKYTKQALSLIFFLHIRGTKIPTIAYIMRRDCNGIKEILGKIPGNTAAYKGVKDYSFLRPQTDCPIDDMNDYAKKYFKRQWEEFGVSVDELYKRTEIKKELIEDYVNEIKAAKERQNNKSFKKGINNGS